SSHPSTHTPPSSHLTPPRLQPLTVSLCGRAEARRRPLKLAVILSTPDPEPRCRPPQLQTRSLPSPLPNSRREARRRRSSRRLVGKQGVIISTPNPLSSTAPPCFRLPSLL
ncbi:hypothetical protein PIB30_115167, partial [Stylosanthes scabra]|nr:hypothetical protein [Stylosanthes scabra]